MEDKKLSNDFKNFIKKNINTIVIGLVLVIMAIILTIATKGVFISARNLSNLFKQMSVVTILSASIFMIIVTGGIDLSVGVFMGLLGAISATFMNKMGISPLMSILMTLLIGAIAGCLQGFIVAYVKVPSFIVTLGGNMVFKGLLILILQGSTISKFPTSYTFFGGAYIPNSIGWIIGMGIVAFITFIMFSNRKKRTKYGLPIGSMSISISITIMFAIVIFGFIALMNAYEGIPVPVSVMLVFVLIVTIISEKTKFGRFVFALGGNQEAAIFAGINVKKTIFLTFVISGVITACASVVYTGRLDAATAQAGNTMELDAIAAAVIGGTSLAGGIGKAPLVMLGALMLALIDNGMSLLNISSDIQLIVKGVVLVLAVVLDVTSNKNKR